VIDGRGLVDHGDGVRSRRLKVRDQTAVYHVISRVVGQERLLDPPDLEVLRRMLWKLADFCGVEVITYALLSNHFHLLLRVPEPIPIPDQELLRRISLLHSAPVVAVARAALASPDPLIATTERRRWTAQMGDLSAYLKALKQRFTRYFNRTHQRIGTLWTERFKSLLVENSPPALKLVAAYIDLNPVRAGLVTDPKDYRFCGYAEALAGDRTAQKGLTSLFGQGSWREVRDDYRLIALGLGHYHDSAEVRGAISAALFDETVDRAGRLSPATLLRCRVRYFSDGCAFGTRAYIDTVFQRHRNHFSPRRRDGPRPLRQAGLPEFAVLRDLRRAPIIRPN
jgi:putative transposase